MKEGIKNLFDQHKGYLLTIAVLGIWVDIFLLESTYSLITSILISFWILVIWLYHVRGRILAIPVTIFLILSPLFANKGEETIADRMAVWVIVFLSLGVLQELFRQRK